MKKWMVSLFFMSFGMAMATEPQPKCPLSQCRRNVRMSLAGEQNLARSGGGESAVALALGKYADSTDLPGLVSGIMSADGTVTIDCFGYADIKSRRRMRPDTLFWIASNTKGIAAALFLTVLDEGKVGLDDPVEMYLPEFAGIRVADKDAPGGVRAPKSKPTVRQLLSHTSGLSFFPKMPIDQWPVRLLADKAAKTPLQSDPGTRYAYSNWGIDCAMAIVESICGKTWDVLLKERILDPLGMTDTTFFPTEEQMARLAKIYVVKDGEAPKLFPSVDQFQWPYSLRTRYPEAGGGLFSTATDMVRFFGMLAHGGIAADGRRILSEKAMVEWCRKQTPASVKDSYSFGMGVDPVDCFIAHGGAYGTFGAANWAKHDVHVYMVQMLGESRLYDERKNAWFKSVNAMLSDKVEGNRRPQGE